MSYIPETKKILRKHCSDIDHDAIAGFIAPIISEENVSKDYLSDILEGFIPDQSKIDIVVQEMFRMRNNTHNDNLFVDVEDEMKRFIDADNEKVIKEKKTDRENVDYITKKVLHDAGVSGYLGKNEKAFEIMQVNMDYAKKNQSNPNPVVTSVNNKGEIVKLSEEVDDLNIEEFVEKSGFGKPVEKQNTVMEALSELDPKLYHKGNAPKGKVKRLETPGDIGAKNASLAVSYIRAHGTTGRMSIPTKVDSSKGTEEIADAKFQKVLKKNTSSKKMKSIGSKGEERFDKMHAEKLEKTKGLKIAQNKLDELTDFL